MLDKDNSGYMEPIEMLDLIRAYETWLYEKEFQHAMEAIYTDKKPEEIAKKAKEEESSGEDESDDGSSSSENSEEKKEEKNQTRSKKASMCFDKALILMSSPQYELAMNIITVCNLFTVFVRALQTSASESTIQQWIDLQIAINVTMLFETLGDIYVQGGPIKAYKYHFRIWPETLCQILNIPAIIYYILNYGDFVEYNYTVKVFEVIVFIRMIKLLTLLYEVKTMRVIFETMKNLLGPLNNLIIVMMTIFYIFA